MDVSETFLKKHGPALVTEARDLLRSAPHARVAGLILLPGSLEAEPLRQAIAATSGRDVPAGLLVGVCPRQMVEELLRARVGTGPWLEERGQPQGVLPVVVSTRDGFRFGFFGLGAAGETEGG
jgi:hypothetical protein